MKAGTFTEEQIIALLQDAQKGEKTVEELCRNLGCSTASFYLWKKRYGDASVAEAKRLIRIPINSFIQSGVATSEKGCGPGPDLGKLPATCKWSPAWYAGRRERQSACFSD